MESALANVQRTNRGVISPMYTATQMKNADWRLLASCIAIAMLGSTAAESQPQAVIYEGARLIVGDASAPIENGAFVVRNGHITAIGPKGSVQAPSGAAHVDLTGKTVMPTMNNIHAHLGYEGYVSWSVENHTAENVLDHLEREAFYGVGSTLSMGEQPTDFAIEFQREPAWPGNFRQPPVFSSRQAWRRPAVDRMRS